MISANFSYHTFKDIVRELELNLDGKTVLTEAATGPYAVTPVIAAYAGAQVHMFARDSSYGTAAEAYEQVMTLARGLKCENRIRIFDPENKQPFDIITNSGHLRPINSTLLSRLSEKGLVLLMYEDWELRKSDIDLDHCLKNNIPVIATNERHELVDVFGFLGDMALKLILDFKVPVYRSNILLVCNNFFGPYIARTLSPLCKNLYIAGADKETYNTGQWVCDFDEFNTASAKLPQSIDHIVYTAYPFQQCVLGNSNKKINASILKEKYPDAILFRYCGDIDAAYCDSIGLKYYPQQVKSGHMGVIPSEIGYEPVIRLQAGSLKAGELALRSQWEFNGDPVAVPINLTQYAL